MLVVKLSYKNKLLNNIDKYLVNLYLKMENTSKPKMVPGPKRVIATQSNLNSSKSIYLGEKCELVAWQLKVWGENNWGGVLEMHIPHAEREEKRVKYTQSKENEEIRHIRKKRDSWREIKKKRDFPHQDTTEEEEIEECNCYITTLEVLQNKEGR